MPVGCLGGLGSSASNGLSSDKSDKMDVIVTSSVLNAADQFAFMQQTLLMQIFRIHSGSPSGSISSSNSSFSCPTCIAFSDHCCQHENGIVLFREFIEANLHCCLWDQKLADALASLRYQGYICPGILVMIANSCHLDLMADLWKRGLLMAPRGSRISQVGLSTGCVVRPIALSHSISLHDVLCLILARLKQRGHVADMNTIIEAVNQDWSSLVNRLKINGSELRDSVHSALGALIKQRKVYYTGNKGCFLVGPNAENGNSSGGSQCAPMLFSAKFSHLRHSMRERSNGEAICSPDGSGKGGVVTIEIDPSSSTSSSNSTSPNSSFNLERSQSLRISKKSLRSLSSKGGSLRLSKKEAANALKKVQEEENAADEAESKEKSANNNKSFERKNSFLSKLFHSSPSNKMMSASKNGHSSQNGNAKIKPKLATFSAQFPEESIKNGQDEASKVAIYSQIGPKNNEAGGPGAIYQQISPLQQVQQRKPDQVPKQTIYGHYATVQRPLASNIYSNPPPPLPYRPPPPNPYLRPPTNRTSPTVAASPTNLRPSPTNMRLSPSPPLASSSASGSTSASNTPPTYARVSNLKKCSNNSPSRNVRFADEAEIETAAASSSSASSNSSSSMDSQNNRIYNESFVVIEQSNKELEKRLRKIDTIHNNKNSLAEEVIYEVECSPRNDPKPSAKKESYPSLSDLSISDIGCTSFKSLTAQKLMAGLSFNSIDTLLEVNAAAEARSKLNESTETVDFGVI